MASKDGPESAVSLLAGKYEIIGAISHGAFGRVLKVRDPELDKIFAAKVLVPSVASLDALKRLSREALALSKLEHPNIVRVYSCQLDETAGLVVVMDYLEGVALNKLIEQSTLRCETIIALAKDICAGLQCAHEHGIFHRDLKPGNVMVVADENGRQRAVLIDFGIAKMQDANQKLTQTGAVLGTPLYMSPEQCTAKALDSKSDIYSFGCVLYEMLVGVPPFTGENAIELAARHTAEQPTPPSRTKSGIPEGFDAIVMKCLEKDPRNRYQTAAAVAADLEDVDIARTAAQFEIASTSRFTRKRMMPSPRYVFPLAAACIASGVAYWSMNHDKAPQSAPSPQVEQYVLERIKEARLKLENGTTEDIGSAKEIAASTLRRIPVQSPEYRYAPALHHICARAFRLEGRYNEALTVLGEERDADFNLDLPDRTALEAGLNYLHKEDFSQAIGKFADVKKFERELSFGDFIDYSIGAAETDFFGKQRKLKYTLADAHGHADDAFIAVGSREKSEETGTLWLELAIFKAECKNGLKQYVGKRDDPDRKWGSVDLLNGVARNMQDMAKPDTTVLRARYWEARAESWQALGKKPEAAVAIQQLKRVLTEKPAAKNQWEADENQLWLNYLKEKLAKLESL